jgi:hypothetical protein
MEREAENVKGGGAAASVACGFLRPPSFSEVSTTQKSNI